MKMITKWSTGVALVLGLATGTAQVLAGPQIPVPEGPPVWCFGANEFGQCVLYLGNEQTCKNLEPCTDASVGLPTTGLTFCFGADDVTGECRLFFGDAQTCANLEPCLAVSGQLPRAPRFQVR